MRIGRVGELHRHLLRPFLAEGDRVVDCTVGNGHDALYLARAVGPAGHLTGFDLQEEALAATSLRLLEAGVGRERFSLLLESHERVGELVAPGIAAAVFNLGYLPGGRHSTATRGETTLRALEGVLPLLRPGGVVTLTLYRGHGEGREEAEILEGYVRSLDCRSFHAVGLSYRNMPKSPPSILLVQRPEGRGGSATGGCGR